MYKEFETWFVAQSFYNKLVFIHGERLFIRRDAEYQILTVEVAYRAYQVNLCNQDN